MMFIMRAKSYVTTQALTELAKYEKKILELK